MENVIVDIANLSHRYSVQWAVRDVSFQIVNRGVYGLLGVNGAGKSTIMNILCGVLLQTKGTVKIAGVDNRQDPVGVKKYIGFLPQTPPVFGDFTVEEYLAFTARLRLMEERFIKSAVEEVLVLCNLTHFRKRLVKHLSGGYQQRVGIAQAIIHKPQLVVLDEPTNGLDPNQILEIRQLIQCIAKERAVIFSTHMLSEVEAICDRILMMNEGRLVFSDTMEAFNHYLSPASVFVSLSSPPKIDQLMIIPGVSSVEELGGISFRIHFSGNVQDMMDELVERSAEGHWAMTEIRQEKSSLDNIFAVLSKK